MSQRLGRDWASRLNDLDLGLTTLLPKVCPVCSCANHHYSYVPTGYEKYTDEDGEEWQRTTGMELRYVECHGCGLRADKDAFVSQWWSANDEDWADECDDYDRLAEIEGRLVRIERMVSAVPGEADG